MNSSQQNSVQINAFGRDFIITSNDTLVVLQNGKIVHQATLPSDDGIEPTVKQKRVVSPPTKIVSREELLTLINSKGSMSVPEMAKEYNYMLKSRERVALIGVVKSLTQQSYLIKCDEKKHSGHYRVNPENTRVTLLQKPKTKAKV